jgi:hypothetical protein
MFILSLFLAADTLKMLLTWHCSAGFDFGLPSFGLCGFRQVNGQNPIRIRGDCLTYINRPGQLEVPIEVEVFFESVARR